MGKQRIIKFKLENLSKEDLKNIGVYKIINTINNHFYIGSTGRKFSERFKEHCRYYEQYKENGRRNLHPALWAAYNECDRYFNMWRGYTSELIHKKDNSKFLNKYKYELI